MLLFPSPSLPPTELLDDILREKPQEADGIDSMVVVDNVPQVGPDRLEKLKNVIHKIFSKFGKITTEFYPEADGMTKGYVLPLSALSWFVSWLHVECDVNRYAPWLVQVHFLGVCCSHSGP